MKSRKRLLSLVMAAIMIAGVTFGMAACGGKDKDDAGAGEKITTEDTNKDSEGKTKEDAGADDKGEYIKGTLSENGFESEYLGIKFTLPEGFIMATEEDINEMMDLGADVMGLDGSMVDYAKVSTVYEMMASAPNGTPNVIIMAEKLMLSNMTVEDYFKEMKSQLETLDIEYILSDEITSVEIAGQTYEKMATTTEMYGVELKQDYMLRKSGNRMIGFIVSYSEDAVESMQTLMDGFSSF